MPQPMPAAEVDVTVGLVRRLLAQQHPDLAELAIEPLASGWDNEVFRLGGELAVRLPRREMAAGIIVNEQRWLPGLASRLPLPVPAPVRTGAPGAGYPWAWSVVPFLPGQPATVAEPSDAMAAAMVLGSFLGALHAPAPLDAPANPFRGVPLAQRAASVAANLRLLRDQVDHAAVLAVWEASLAVPAWDGSPVWLHGDPHPANILVHDGRVSAVIDFGDITAGDPATDLAMAWMALPGGSHDAFRAAYASAAGRPVTGSTWARGRGWALSLALVLLAYSADNPPLLRVGRRALRAVLGAGLRCHSCTGSSGRLTSSPMSRSSATQWRSCMARTG